MRLRLNKLLMLNINCYRVKCITWNVQTSWPEQNLGPLLGFKITKQPKSGLPLAKKQPFVSPHIFVIR